MVKKVTLLWILIGFGSAYGMERAINRKPSIDQLMQGCLFLSFPQIEKNPDLLIQGREILQRKIVDGKDDKTKKIWDYFLTMFNVATLLPQDVQQVIVLKMLNDDKVQLDKLFDKPIRNILRRCLYFEAYQVMDGALYPKFSRYASDSGKLADVCKVDTIFSLLSEIKTFESLAGRPVVYNRKECEEVCALADAFGEIKKMCIDYNYHKAYTLSNIYKSISETQSMIFIVLAAPFLSACIEQGFCVKVPNQAIIDENTRRAISNNALRAKYEITGNPVFKGRWGIKDPLCYRYIDWLKIILPHTLVVPSWIAMDEYVRPGSSALSDIKEKMWFLGGTVGYAAFSFFASQGIYLGVSSLLQSDKVPLLVSGLVLVNYVAGCLILNMRYMRSSKEERVWVSDLPSLLKNRNIIIE
jgi:hypothetical protein